MAFDILQLRSKFGGFLHVHIPTFIYGTNLSTNSFILSNRGLNYKPNDIFIFNKEKK